MVSISGFISRFAKAIGCSKERSLESRIPRMIQLILCVEQKSIVRPSNDSTETGSISEKQALMEEHLSSVPTTYFLFGLSPTPIISSSNKSRHVVRYQDDH